MVIKVHDSYHGEAFNPPPIAAVVNTRTTMSHTFSPNGEISALLPDDFEGLLMIGAPLRKTVPIAVTKDHNEYEVLLEPVVKLTATLSDENLVLKIQWNSIDPRDIGDKKLIPYSVEVLAITSDSGVKPLGKYDPSYFSSTSGEDTITMPLSPEGEIPPEMVSGALVARIYIDYEIKTRNYWSELGEFGEMTWMQYLTYYAGSRYNLMKIPLIQVAFNPFADPSLREG